MTLTSIPEQDRVFQIDVVATSDTSLVTCAGFAAAPDAESSRIYLNFDDWWGAHEVSEDFMASVAYKDGVLYAIGKNGLIKVVGHPGRAFTRDAVKGKFRTFSIDACEHRGHLTKVRATASGFVVCGWGGQLYRLSGDTWSPLTSSKSMFADRDLLDIDGTAAGELYAVGLSGTVLYFDGHSWRAEDMPTNNHFYAVKCLSDGEVLLAGANGSLYSGHHNHWHAVDSGVYGNFWSIEEFQGAAYLTCADRQMYKLAHGRIDQIALPHDIHTHRLSAGPSTLLSCGSDTVLRFDGNSWHQVVFPDMA